LIVKVSCLEEVTELLKSLSQNDFGDALRPGRLVCRGVWLLMGNALIGITWRYNSFINKVIK
jgi:hypothetical protein